MIFRRFYIVRVIIIIHVFLPTDAVSGVIRNVDPIKAYPKGIVFDVKRDGEQVGQHKVQFRQKSVFFVKLRSKSAPETVLAASFDQSFARKRVADSAPTLHG